MKVSIGKKKKSIWGVSIELKDEFKIFNIEFVMR